MKNNRAFNEKTNFFHTASQAVIGFGIMVIALAANTSLELTGTMSALLSIAMVFGIAVMMLNVILACDALCDMRESNEEESKYIVYDYEGKNIVRKTA